MVKCMVCGKEIDEKNWLAQGADQAWVNDTVYYVCGLQHKNKFIASPERHLEEAKERAEK